MWLFFNSILFQVSDWTSHPRADYIFVLLRSTMNRQAPNNSHILDHQLYLLTKDFAAGHFFSRRMVIGYDSSNAWIYSANILQYSIRWIMHASIGYGEELNCWSSAPPTNNLPLFKTWSNALETLYHICHCGTLSFFLWPHPIYVSQLVEKRLDKVCHSIVDTRHAHTPRDQPLFQFGRRELCWEEWSCDERASYVQVVVATGKEDDAVHYH